MLILLFAPVFFFVLWWVSEFRSPRWLRLVFGTAAVLCAAGAIAIWGFMQRIELADHFRIATANLAYAVETTTDKGRMEETRSILSAFHQNQGSFPMGTPPDYYQDIQSTADQISDLKKGGR